MKQKKLHDVVDQNCPIEISNWILNFLFVRVYFSSMQLQWCNDEVCDYTKDTFWASSLGLKENMQQEWSRKHERNESTGCNFLFSIRSVPGSFLTAGNNRASSTDDINKNVVGSKALRLWLCAMSMKLGCFYWYNRFFMRRSRKWEHFLEFFLVFSARSARNCFKSIV